MNYSCSAENTGPKLPVKQERYGDSKEVPLPDSVGHAVGSDGSHYAQALQSWLVLPFLRELLLFRTLRFNKFLPPFCRTLNIPIQVSEFLHGWESLEKIKEGLKENSPTFLWTVLLTLLTARVLLLQKGHRWSLGTTARNPPGSDFVHSPFPRSVVSTLSQEQESTWPTYKATGKYDWGRFPDCGRSSELKGVSRLPTERQLHLTQPPLMLSPSLPQPVEPHTASRPSPQQSLGHGSLELTTQERMKEFGIIHNAVLRNPKRGEICSPVLKPELKNLRWRALATVSYPRNAWFGRELEVLSPCLTGEHTAGIPVGRKSANSLLPASTDTTRIALQKSQPMEKCAFVSRALSIQS